MSQTEKVTMNIYDFSSALYNTLNLFLGTRIICGHLGAVPKINMVQYVNVLQKMGLQLSIHYYWCAAAALLH